MGCDIHMIAEVKRNGKWVAIKDPVFDCMWYRKNKPFDTFNQPKTVRPYDGRNYNLFGILANVRNGTGFAGIKTGAGFSPIDEPRGWPDDIDEYSRGDDDNYMGDHSFSHLLLSELLSYDWNQVTMQQGWVGPKEYAEYKANGKPDGWCGEVSGTIVRHVSNEFMDRGKFKEGLNYYTKVTWGSSYRDAVGNWWFEKTMPQLSALDPNPENVRIIFGFDS